MHQPKKKKKEILDMSSLKMRIVRLLPISERTDKRIRFRDITANHQLNSHEL